MKQSMDNLGYLVLASCGGLVALMVKYTRGDMARGMRRIRKCWPF